MHEIHIQTSIGLFCRISNTNFIAVSIPNNRLSLLALKAPAARMGGAGGGGLGGDWGGPQGSHRGAAGKDTIQMK